jgi:hypothetical protein
MLSSMFDILDPSAAKLIYPLATQISSYLAANRRRQFGAVGKVTLNALEMATAQNREFPSDIDEGYILDAMFQTSEAGEGSFTIVWSTIRMSQFDIGEIVHSDCTYKCTWNTYPVTVIGFSDKNRKFHPTIVAISSRETHVEFQFIFEAWKKVNPRLDFKLYSPL